jgi:hypothetical protein
MKRILALFLLLLLPLPAFAQSGSWPDLGYRVVPDFLRLPPGANLGEVTAVELNSKGHIFVFNRGPRPIMEFDRHGDFIRSLGEGLFTTAHGLRIDAEDNIWTTDVDSHLVLKLSPEGRLLMVLGRKGTAGELDPVSSMVLFNKPADVAFGPSGDIFLADGYGNSRVVKLDKYGKFIKSWGKKGSAEGEFNLPHTVVVDSQGLVFVGDRENKRIQIFDSEGRFIQQWNHVGSPWWLQITPDQSIWVVDGYASRILKLDRNGNILGAFGEPGKAPGQFGFAHALAVGPEEEIYVAEILNWRVQKFVKK